MNISESMARLQEQLRVMKAQTQSLAASRKATAAKIALDKAINEAGELRSKELLSRVLLKDWAEIIDLEGDAMRVGGQPLGVALAEYLASAEGQAFKPIAKDAATKATAADRSDARPSFSEMMGEIESGAAVLRNRG